MPRNVEEPQMRLSYAIAPPYPSIAVQAATSGTANGEGRRERLLRYLCDWAPHLLKRRLCGKVPEATGTV